MNRTPDTNANLTALGYYALGSAICFGLPVLGSPAKAHVGFLSDPSAMIWCMAWWPYAIAQRLNPFITKAIWAPAGYNLTWATSIAAVSIALAPITLSFGPVVSYNLAALMAPALSGWAAFLLCRRATRNFWAAFAGGLIYGFSPYEVGHVLAGHLSLTPVFVPPLCALLALALVQGAITPRRFAIAFTVLLVLQCLISTEILATMTLVGAVAVAAAIVLIPTKRHSLLTIVPPLACSYIAATIIVAPFLYYAFAAGALPKEVFFPTPSFSADLLSFVIPGPLMLVQPPGTEAVVSQFGGNMFENGSYFSLSLLAVAGVYFWERWREPVARLLIVLLAIIGLAALGPELHVDGRPIVALPWSWVLWLPLLQYALPIRLACYGFLVLAIICSVCISDPGATMRRVAVTAVAVALFPNPAFLLQRSCYDAPAFFTDDLYHRYLERGENVLVIPYGITGPSMVWQAESKMYFRMAGGYIGLEPEEFRKWPLLGTLTNSIPVPAQAEQFREFAAAYKIGAIVVAGGATKVGRELAPSLGLKPISVGGVSFYRMPHNTGGAPTARQLEAFQRAAAEAWLMKLLCAARRFVADGGDPRDLNPAQASRLGLLPGSQWSANLPLLLAGLRTGGSNGLWIGSGARGAIEVGLPASGAVAGALASRYAADATRVLYPYPNRYSDFAFPTDRIHFLLMTLRPAALRYCGADLVNSRATAVK